MDSHLRMIVQNAMITANPPPVQPITAKKLSEEQKLTPIELFMNHLFYERLKPSSVHVVLDLLRSLPWNSPVEQEIFRKKDSESQEMKPPESEEGADKAPVEKKTVDCRDFLQKIFTKPWKVRYNQLELFASLLWGLQKYHSDFVVEVVDDVLEEIRYGLEEHTHFQYQQRRVSLVRYLGHLFNSRVASLGCLFNTLYLLITFGHPNGKPSKTGVESPLDPRNDFFRIRLVAELLDTVAGQIIRAVKGRALDDFITYYQYYIFTKNTEEMPFEVKFIVDDVFQKIMTLTGPQLTVYHIIRNRFTSFEQADAALLEVEKSTFGKSSVEVDQEEDEEEANYESSSSIAEEDLQKGSSSAEISPSGSSSNLATAADTEPEKASPKKYVVTREEEEAFAKEFQEMLSESITSRKNEKKVALDVHLPLSVKSSSSGSLVDKQSKMSNGTSKKKEVQNEEKPEERIKFRVLTKGKSGMISVPANSAIAISTLTNQENLKREQVEIKDRVLAIHSRSEDN